MEEHLVHVKEVIQNLNKGNIIMNDEKCHFAQKSINLLGSTVSEHGKSINTRKLSNIEEWLRHRTGTDIQRFSSFLNYLCDHIPKAAVLMSSLVQLRNGKRITVKEWTSSMETHLKDLRKVVVLREEYEQVVDMKMDETNNFQDEPLNDTSTSHD
ncbi:hypothetical protein [Parasitella parasitica]|uniref:Uncharacterized protein n=1 Tax=Parasitella parasitica TaxID=35722 RepID=A0A0B7MZF2_9FUNG|nr:hypothetical protein [Parasitella parasitica]